MEFSQDGGIFSFKTYYNGSHNALDVGLLSQTGEEICLTVSEPSWTYQQITGIPAGTYQVFVRNPQSNALGISRPSLAQVNGALIFTLSGGSIVFSPEA